MEYQAHEAYPKLACEKKNLYYASLLLEDYAGAISEETAVNQYIYQSLAIKEPEVAEVLKNIAIVEMRHLEYLGKTITMLGAKPKFKTLAKQQNYLVPWTSKVINYSTNILDFLEYNIRLEYLAIKNYQKHIKLINDSYIKNLLKRIIKDEEKHIECFKELMAKIAKEM